MSLPLSAIQSKTADSRLRPVSPAPSRPPPLLASTSARPATTILCSAAHRDLPVMLCSAQRPACRALQALQHAKKHTRSKLEDRNADKAPDVSITVQHFPLYVCPLMNAAFVLPSSSPITAARSVLNHTSPGNNHCALLASCTEYVSAAMKPSLPGLFCYFCVDVNSLCC